MHVVAPQEGEACAAYPNFRTGSAPHRDGDPPAAIAIVRSPRPDNAEPHEHRRLDDPRP